MRMRTDVPEENGDRAVQSHVPEPRLELLMETEVTLGPVLDLGSTPYGHRRIVPISGGRFSGPRLDGVVLPGGADWQIIHPKGWVRVEARYTLQVSNGDLISVVSQGVRHGPADVMAELLAGGSPDPATYRFRTAVTLETSSSDYYWLNHIIAVGSADRAPAAVHQNFYEVL